LLVFYGGATAVMDHLSPCLMYMVGRGQGELSKVAVRMARIMVRQQLFVNRGGAMTEKEFVNKVSLAGLAANGNKICCGCERQPTGTR
jgi:hypothetical protein